MAKKQTKTAAQALFPEINPQVTEMSETNTAVTEKARKARVLKDKKVFVLLELFDVEGNPLPKGTVIAKLIGSYTTDQVDDVMAARDEHPNAHHFTVNIKMAKD